MSKGKESSLNERKEAHGLPRFERQVTRSSSQAAARTWLRIYGFFRKSMEPDHCRAPCRQLGSMP